MNLKQIYKYILAILMLSFLYGCKSTKWVPENSKLLSKNEIYVNNKKVNKSELKNIIKQQPNRKLLFFRPYLSLYNIGNPNKEKGISKWFTKIGEEPVIEDSLATLISARQLGIYAFSKGYFNSTTAVQKIESKNGRKVTVRYDLYTGSPYYFGQTNFLIASQNIEDLVRENHSDSKIKAGEIYDASILDAERNRLVKIFRNSGFYAFPKELIKYEADTTVGNRNVNLTMTIADMPVYYEDSIYYKPHQPFNIKNVYIDPNFSYADKDVKKDTSTYENYKFLNQDKSRFKESLLISSIHFEPGDLYQEKVVSESYSHLTSLRVFRSSEIKFKPTPEGKNELDAIVLLKPIKNWSTTFEIEGINTAGNFGVSGSYSILNRSLFNRGEIFDITLRGGLEAQSNLSGEPGDLVRVWEYGIEFGINFPRFLIPYRWQAQVPKRMVPKTRISASTGIQKRQEFDRNYLNLGLGYFWKASRTRSHAIQLIDYTYVRLENEDEDYLNSLQFSQSFQDVFITASRYTFTYNNQKFTNKLNSSFFIGSFEVSGNMLSLMNLGSVGESGQKEIEGVPYSQYYKIDLDYRNYTEVGRFSQIVWRAYAGYTHTYGNSNGLPPFEKSYFSGGSNDIRGWYAYRLGPGNYPNNLYNTDSVNYSATGPIKLMFNFEYRFPILNSLKGAIFFDMGNIWIYDRPLKGENIPNQNQLDLMKFKFENLGQQIAMSPGLGLRYDFGFFVFRLDAGYKLFDPSQKENNRLNPKRIENYDFQPVTLNIAIGYPF